MSREVGEAVGSTEHLVDVISIQRAVYIILQLNLEVKFEQQGMCLLQGLRIATPFEAASRLWSFLNTGSSPSPLQKEKSDVPGPV